MKEFDKRDAENILKNLTKKDEKEYNDLVSEAKKKFEEKKKLNGRVLTFINEGVFPTVKEHGFYVSNFGVAANQKYGDYVYEIYIEIDVDSNFDYTKKDKNKEAMYVTKDIQDMKKEINKSFGDSSYMVVIIHEN